MLAEAITVASTSSPSFRPILSVYKNSVSPQTVRVFLRSENVSMVNCRIGIGHWIGSTLRSTIDNKRRFVYNSTTLHCVGKLAVFLLTTDFARRCAAVFLRHRDTAVQSKWEQVAELIGFVACSVLLWNNHHQSAFQLSMFNLTKQQKTNKLTS